MYKRKIREIIREAVESLFPEARIANTDADEFVEKKQNFVGSHTYGENIGGLNKMYVAYSYGEQHPLYVWMDKEEFKELRPHEYEDIQTESDSSMEEVVEVHLYNEEIEGEENSEIEFKEGPWFYNENPYYIEDDDGGLKINKWTRKHRNDLKPSEKVQARDTRYLKRLISDFKKKYKIGSNSHTDLEPGEK